MLKKLFNNNPLPVVILTVFVDILGYGILIPVMPLLLTDPASPDFLLPGGVSIKTGYILFGLLVAAYPIMQFFATPVLGQLSDRYGRKKILGLSLAGTCVSYVIFAIAIISKNIPLLFLSRAFDGFTGGNLAVAQASIADVTAPKDRAKSFGLIGAVFGFGFIIGPFLGGKLADPNIIRWFSVTTPFWFAAILSFLNTLSVIFFFPETHPNVDKGLKLKWGQSIKNIIEAFKLPGLTQLYIMVFLFASGVTFFTTFFSVYLIQKLSFTQSNIGNYFAYIGIWIALAQGFIIRKIPPHKEQAVLKVSLLMLSIGTLLHLLPRNTWQLYMIAPLFAVFNGLAHANSAGLISQSATPEIQGKILGINSSMQALAQTFPPVLSGFLAAGTSPSAPTVVAGVILFLAWVAFMAFYRPAPVKSTQPIPAVDEVVA